MSKNTETVAPAVETNVSKRPRVITTTIIGQTLTFNVAGTNQPLVLDAAALSDEVRESALLHGLRQKVSDAAALGAGATPAEKLAAMQAIVASLNDGDWTQRTGDGTSQPSGLIFRAFYRMACESCAAKSRPEPSIDAARALYDKMSRAEQLALRTVPRIAVIMDELRVSPSAKSIDVDALFAEFD